MAEVSGRVREVAARVPTEQGHLLIALMVAITVMTILLGAAAEQWSTILRRDREAELIFRGKQYAQAITEFQKEQGALPMDLDLLIKKGPKNHRYIRKLFKEPFAKDGKWGRLVMAPGGQAVVNPLTQEMRPTSMLARGPGQGQVGQPVGPQTPQQFGLRAPRQSGRFPNRQQPPQPATPPGGSLFRSSVTQISPFPPEQLVNAPIAGVASANLKLKSFKIYEGYDWIRDWWFTAYNLGQGQAGPPAAPQGFVPGGYGPGMRVQPGRAPKFGGNRSRTPGRQPGGNPMQH